VNAFDFLANDYLNTQHERRAGKVAAGLAVGSKKFRGISYGSWFLCSDKNSKPQYLCSALNLALASAWFLARTVCQYLVISSGGGFPRACRAIHAARSCFTRSSLGSAVFHRGLSGFSKSRSRSISS
jgi:hypothetical protein